jgi:hypothetical protein
MGRDYVTQGCTQASHVNLFLLTKLPKEELHDVHEEHELVLPASSAAIVSILIVILARKTPMHTHNSIDSTNLQVLVKQDSATIT